LTEIFQKLGVSDRLNLALVLAADSRISCANAENRFDGGSRFSDIKPTENGKYKTVNLVA
jgi:hypothetical protein